MYAKTKKADKVREYYIEIEKLIDKYKENNKKIQILENEKRKTTILYVIYLKKLMN
jgi:hypothetical protein